MWDPGEPLYGTQSNSARLCIPQALGTVLPPAERAQARLLCKHWRDALAATFTELYVGPAALASRAHASHASGATQLPWQLLGSYFPAVTGVQLVTSSSREYPNNFPEVSSCRQWLCTAAMHCHGFLCPVKEAFYFKSAICNE